MIFKLMGSQHFHLLQDAYQGLAFLEVQYNVPYPRVHNDFAQNEEQNFTLLSYGAQTKLLLSVSYNRERS